MKYYIQTLGCAMNYSDSERVASILEKIGYSRTQTVEDTDLYIFNTCSIRQKGEDRVFGQLRNVNELKKKNPRLLVGITGCMVRKTSSRNSEKETKDELIKRLVDLDFVFKITDTHKLGEVLEEAEPQLDLPGQSEAEPLANKSPAKAGQPGATEGSGGHSSFMEGQATDYLQINPKYTSKFQAFVPIQIGCDKYCTYCIVPYARGREKSRDMNEIVEECARLVDSGCKEITLVGQTVNSYGKSMWDKKTGAFAQYEDPFVELLTRVDKLSAKGLNRLRFTSPHPRDLSDALIQAHADLKTLTNHIHLPVQAGDDEMLKKMNRQYTTEHYKNLIKKIREKIPEASVTTDIIVGFCGETDEQFEGTKRLYEDLRFDMAYLARYSPRRGTASWNAWQDDVPRTEKARRWHALNDILEECTLAFHRSLEGKTLEVLVEKFDETTGECEGKSRENKVVQFVGDASLIGTLQNVKVTKGMQWMVKGERGVE